MTKEELLDLERSIPRDGKYSQYGSYKAMENWILESNRWKHLIGGFVLGLFLTFLCALGCAGGMEFKDRQWGGKWDWIDFGCTCFGGLFGQALQLIFIWAVL